MVANAVNNICITVTKAAWYERYAKNAALTWANLAGTMPRSRAFQQYSWPGNWHLSAFICLLIDFILCFSCHGIFSSCLSTPNAHILMDCCYCLPVVFHLDRLLTVLILWDSWPRTTKGSRDQTKGLPPRAVRCGSGLCSEREQKEEGCGTHPKKKKQQQRFF